MELGFWQLALRSQWTTFLLAAIPEQRSKPVPLPICRAEPVALSGQEAQWVVLPGWVHHPVSCVGCGVCSTAPPRQRTKLEALPIAEYSLHTHLTKKSNQRTWETP